MSSLMQTMNRSAAQVVTAIGSVGGVVSKNMGALDRASDVSYSHADTFVINTELRNKGSIQDTILDEEERDLEREMRRLKLITARDAYVASLTKAKVKKTRKS